MILLFISLFGVCSAQNVTLAALQRIIPNCSLINEKFVDEWNVMTAGGRPYLCDGFDENYEKNCVFPHEDACHDFVSHRILVKKFVGFLSARLFDKLSKKTPSDLTGKLKHLFWQIDLREDNKFNSTWESFKIERTSLLGVSSQYEALVAPQFDDELWTFQEIRRLRFWEQLEEYQKNHTFPYDTTKDNYVIELLGWDMYEKYYDSFYYTG